MQMSLDEFFVCLHGGLLNLLKQFIFAVLSQIIELTLKILCLKCNFLVPSRTFHNQTTHFSAVTLHVSFNQSIEDLCKSFSNVIEILLLKLANIPNYFLLSVILNKLQL